MTMACIDSQGSVYQVALELYESLVESIDNYVPPSVARRTIMRYRRMMWTPWEWNYDRGIVKNKFGQIEQEY